MERRLEGNTDGEVAKTGKVNWGKGIPGSEKSQLAKSHSENQTERHDMA